MVHTFTFQQQLTPLKLIAIKEDMMTIEKYLMENNILSLHDGMGGKVGVGYGKHHFAFNGPSGMSHETFYLGTNSNGYNTCRTMGKPYDLAVCMILLCIREIIPDCEITSTGNNGDWGRAYIMVGRLFPEYELYEINVDGNLVMSD